MFGLFLVFCALFLLLALLSFDAGDPSLNYVKSGVTEANNKAGLFGAYIAGLLNDHFGIGSFICPCVFLALAAAHISPAIILHWWRWAGFFLFTLFFLVISSAFDFSIGDLSGGGMLGNTLHTYSVRYLSPAGSFLLWSFVALAGIQLIANFSWISLSQNLLTRFQNWHHTTLDANQNHGAAASKRFGISPDRARVILHDTVKFFKKLLARLPQRKNPPAMPMPHTATAQTSITFPAFAPAVAPQKPANQEQPPAPACGQPYAFDAAGEEDDPFAPIQELRPDTLNTTSTKCVQQPAIQSISDEKGPDNTEFTPLSSENDTIAQEIVDTQSTTSADEALPEIASVAKTITVPEQKDENQQPEPPDAQIAVIGQGSPATPQNKPSVLRQLFRSITGHTEEQLATALPEPQSASQSLPDVRLFTEPKEIVFPSPGLLNPPKPMPAATPDDLRAKGEALMQCFSEFDINGELAGITPGPVVTMFEMRPAPGIRVSKIANLADDLSRSLKAVAVRIQAPIPGSDTVGIEIPNELRETVNFRELVESPLFTQDKGQLTMILGKTIAGEPFMADLARMPHMLVAGATGAGKSVCLNSILVSLLFRMPPAKMRLLLVDPKRIELAVYADLPHLVHPVVTEMDDAKNALEWAVQDMKNRYKTFERMGVRNIVAYHQKLKSFGGNPPPGLEDMTPLPYMVIVIDELADLMMTAAKEVETSIVRLAQLARAAGIHMILATQRPSVDVVTGLIKANFPCRISFQVTSKHDSRTILDQVGAEHLLGRGDMLFKPSGGRLLRLHGPFLTDEEVQAVANHWKAQLPPEYQVDFSQWSAENAQANPSVGGDATTDALYGEARDFVLGHGRASISLLQRHLKIGFNRAARLMEQFERDGIIGPADGSKPRNVIR